MARIQKTVFISYRRRDISWALAVYQYLTSQKYDVFFDFSSLSSGDFEQVIISNIRARAHFVLILTPTALDRCSEPGDWLRREIETAIDEKRNIIPLFLDDFSFELPLVVEKLTGKLRNIRQYNGLVVPAGYFLEAMERLRSRYLNVPLDAVIHPVPIEIRKVVEKEQVAANKALQRNIEDLAGLIQSEKWDIQDRVLEAAIENKVHVGRPASLFVWIRRLESKSIISVVSSIDEDVVLDEDNVKSKELEIEFPVENGRILPAGISLKLVAHEFTPLVQQKSIMVPPEGDSEVCTFIVTPKQAGNLLLNLEVLRDDVSLANRTIRTIAVETVETKETVRSPLVLMSIPVVVLVQGNTYIVKKESNSSYGDVAVGDHKQMADKQAPEQTLDVFEPTRLSMRSLSTLRLFGIVASILFLVTLGIFGINLWSRTLSPTPSPTSIESLLTPIPQLILGSTKTSSIDQMIQLYVPAGHFSMGSNRANEGPPDTPFLNGYWIDQTEVTNAMYAICVQAEDCSEPSNTIYFRNPSYANYPVVFVSWNDAYNYCRSVYRRLPTEAEWEKAASWHEKDEVKTIYPWGNEIDCSLANYKDVTRHCVGRISPVGRYSSGSSFYGALDMTGNVWEWVNSLYQSYPYALSDGREDINASGDRVLRGGSWNSNYYEASTTFRLQSDPSQFNGSIGFRCAESP